MADGKWANVGNARIGSGAALIGLGLVAMLLGAVLLLGSSAGETGQAGGAFFLAVGGFCVPLGIFIRMASRIELRLMDIESAIRNPASPSVEPSASAPSSPDEHWQG